MSVLIKQHLLRAQARMKQHADKKRSELSFSVGDKVFVKLQSSLACLAHQKLAFKYFGHYTIQEKIGSVAYKLNLPADSAIYPVFHISQLKKLVRTSADSSVLPNDHVEYQVPEKVLVTRVKKNGTAEVTQVLIKWSHMSEELATWEDKVSLMQQFPFCTCLGSRRGGGGC
jgi:hypothetical protein